MNWTKENNNSHTIRELNTL